MQALAADARADMVELRPLARPTGLACGWRASGGGAVRRKAGGTYPAGSGAAAAGLQAAADPHPRPCAPASGDPSPRPPNRIVATVADYGAVRVLVEKLFSEGIEATVPATVRETVVAVAACVGGGVGEVSLTALAQKMKLDKNSAHHRVRKAIERGYLVNREEKRGMPARIAIADPLPDEIENPADYRSFGGLLECWSFDGGDKKRRGEIGGSEAERPGPLLPPNSNPNTPTLSDIAPVFDARSISDPVDSCDYCGKPADHQPLRRIAVGDGRQGWLHRRCEVPWAEGLTLGSSVH